MAAMYAVYHGPSGLQRIAKNIHQAAQILKIGIFGICKLKR